MHGIVALECDDEQLPSVVINRMKTVNCFTAATYFFYTYWLRFVFKFEKFSLII